MVPRMSTDPARDDLALSIACPRCEAVVGEPCHTSEGQTRATHRRRTNAFLASLEPLTDEA
jgi:hypothetical protein